MFLTSFHLLHGQDSDIWLLDKFKYICRVISFPLILSQVAMGVFGGSKPEKYSVTDHEIKVCSMLDSSMN